MKFDNAAAHMFQKLPVCEQLFFRPLNIDFEQVDVGEPVFWQISSIVHAFTATPVLLVAIELPQAGASVVR